jgi:hypothetical protein
MNISTVKQRRDVVVAVKATNKSTIESQSRLPSRPPSRPPTRMRIRPYSSIECCLVAKLTGVRGRSWRTY